MALRGIAHGVRCCARGAGAGVRAAARRPYVHAVGLNVRVPQYQPHRRMLLFAQRLLGTGGERSCSSSSSSSFEDPRERILDFALARVDEDGWSELALAKGAKDAGLPSVASGMFTRGAVELVEHFMTSSLEELKVQCGKRSQELDPLSAEERLVEAMMIRLEAIQPHISSWPQAMALGLLPHNAPRTAQALADIADELAFQTGDRSTDGRWYAKRAVVAGAYISAELYMLTDKSEGFRDTRAFVQRVAADYSTMTSAPQSLSDIILGASTAAASIGTAVISLLEPALKQAPGISTVVTLAPAAQAVISQALEYLSARSPIARHERGASRDERGYDADEVLPPAPEDDPLDEQYGGTWKKEEAPKH